VEMSGGGGNCFEELGKLERRSGTLGKDGLDRSVESKKTRGYAGRPKLGRGLVV